MWHLSAGQSTGHAFVSRSDRRLVCRVPKLCDAEVALALDAGAQALICPMVNSAEEATAFVTAAHFPPHGRRSYGPHRAAWAMGGAFTPSDFARAQNAARSLGGVGGQTGSATQPRSAASPRAPQADRIDRWPPRGLDQVARTRPTPPRASPHRTPKIS